MIKDKFSLKKFGKVMFNIFLILPGIFFLITGFQWLVAPETAASSLMMPLLSGAGLSTQIGDIGGLFLGMGLLVMAAITTRKSELLFSVSVILFCIAIYRLMAFILHDATLNIQMLGVEFVLAVWFFIASRNLYRRGKECIN